MQQPMAQFLANFGLYNLNIKCREAVHIFHWLWNGRNFCMNFSQFEHFFNEMDTYSSNGYQLVLLQLCSISTVMLEGLNLNMIWKSSKNTNMLFFENKILKLMIAIWKLPTAKVYHGLNNALGICVHKKHYQVLPTQMVPISALAHGLNVGIPGNLETPALMAPQPRQTRLLFLLADICFSFQKVAEESVSTKPLCDGSPPAPPAPPAAEEAFLASPTFRASKQTNIFWKLV